MQALQACGWTIGKVSGVGLPDLIAVRGGAVRLLEVKSGKQKLRESQTWWDGVLPVTVLRTADEAIQWSAKQ